MFDRQQFKNKHENFGIKTSDPVFDADNRPVCLHVAIDNPVYRSSGIIQGFEQAGYRTIQFNWQSVKLDVGVDGMLERLVMKAKMESPDLIFLHIQNENILDEYTCKELTSIAPTVLYTFDCRHKEQTQWIYDLVPHLTAVFFSNLEDVMHCKELGFENTFVLQSSADPLLYYPLPKVTVQYPDVVFIGGNYLNTNLNFDYAKERQEMVSFMDDVFKMDSHHTWGSFGMGQRTGRYIHPQEENLIYGSCKIAINHSNFYRYAYSSDRLWRIMFSGCFCLTKYFPGIEKIFEKEIHLDWWHNFDELKQLVKFYLNDDEERKSIAKAGHLFVTENHTWRNRVEEIKSHLQYLVK